MATLPGGPSNTIPSEFQSLWIARLLLDLLAERFQAIEIEPATGDTYKAECLVYVPDGTVEAHQCKMHNAAAGTWSAADLRRRHVLMGARKWLDQDQLHRFVFVSGDGVPGLRDLCRRARDIEKLTEFWAASETNDALRRDRNVLISALGVDETKPEEQLRLQEFCRRFRVELRPEENQRRDVEDRAAALVIGDAAACVQMLENVANTTYQSMLHPSDIANLLRKGGFELSDLTKQTALGPLIDEYNERFQVAIRPLLLRGAVLKRNVTDDLLKIGRNGSSKVLLVHGEGGCGKTGVIFEMIERVRADNEPYLVISLNQDTLRSQIASNDLEERMLALPVESLSAVAGNRIALLFIDQLDAVRWTAHHSADALHRVRDLVRRLDRHPNIRLVIACRSFDAQDDDRIRTLFEMVDKSTVGLERREVPPLSSNERDRVLTDLGVVTASLSDRQRDLLCNPQRLWLLSKLVDEQLAPSFNSSADLNGSFWRWIRAKQLAPHERQELDTQLLPDLLKHDSSSSGARVPQILVDRHPGLIAKLYSVGVLLRAGRQTRFSHQSHYDYLAAARMVETVAGQPGGIIQWCAQNDSLFQRNQLRQYLELLRVDQPERFVQSVEKLLHAADVRFHLKAAAIGVFGADSEPTRSSLQLVKVCLSNADLRPHILSQAQRNRRWFSYLNEDGLLTEWLSSDDPALQSAAAMLLQAHAALPDGAVVNVLNTLPDDQASVVRRQIYWGVRLQSVSRPVFDDCLQWLRQVNDAKLTPQWKELASASPKRAAELLEAVVQRMFGPLEAEQPANDVDDMRWFLRSASEEMLQVAERHPLHILRTCDYGLRRLAELRRAMRAKRRAKQRPSYDERQRYKGLAGTILKLATTAAKVLASKRPDLTLKIAKASIETSDRLRHRVAVTALRSAPPLLADDALRFLSDHPNLLTCGKRRTNSTHRGSSTIPARNLIRCHSWRASAATVTQLEQVIRRIIPPWELTYWRSVHESHMGRGYLGNGVSFPWIIRRTIFATQYLLLDAFPYERLSESGKGWLGVLREKFGSISGLVPDPPKGRGGFIGPSIPWDRAMRLSDKRWLRLMTDQKAKDPERKHRWRNDLTESSPWQFAQLLADAVHREPARFAMLAVQLPAEVPAEYVSALLEGLSRTKRPEKEASADWAAADTATTEAAFLHLSTWLPNREVACSLCWLVQRRGDEHWSDAVLALIENLAHDHEDPAAGRASVHLGTGGKMEPDYVASALNCVRGAACAAWQSLSWQRQQLEERTWSLLDHLVTDPHPAVRIAAIDICIPMLRADRVRAIKICRALVEQQEEAVLRAHGLNMMLSYTSSDDEMQPVISMMLDANDGEVAKQGAEWSTLNYLADGEHAQEVEKAMQRNSKTREGVAEVLGRHVHEHLHRPEVLAWHKALLNDHDEQVRAQAASFVSSTRTLRTAAVVPLLKSFIASNAFAHHVGKLTYAILAEPESVRHLTDVVAALVNRMVAVKEKLGHELPMATHKLPDLVLRLYEECEDDPAAAETCLDVIDDVIRDRLAYNLLPKID